MTAPGLINYINFTDRMVEQVFRPSDLFVTVESGRGSPPVFNGTNSEHLTDILTHVPMGTWWDDDPSATTHGTIADEVVGEHVLGDGNHIKPLR